VISRRRIRLNLRLSPLRFQGGGPDPRSTWERRNADSNHSTLDAEGNAGVASGDEAQTMRK
jgi:hypothetical protein